MRIVSLEREKFQPLAISLGVLSFFWFWLWLYGVNAPSGDDYDAILLYIINIKRHPEFWERLRLTLAQHNEHRIAFTRLLALGTYLQQGNLDFKLLIYLGCLALPGLVLALYRIGPAKGAAFLPVMLIIFEAQYYEAAFWAMGSSQNLFVMFFSLCALWALSKPGKPGLGLGFGLALAAGLTSGSGLLLYPVGALFLLSQRRVKELGFWLTAGGAACAAYFIGYVSPPHPSALAALNEPIEVLKYFLSILGAAPGFSSSASVFFGCLLGILFLALSVKGYWRVNPTHYFFFLLLLAMAATASLTRFGLGPQSAFAPRYKIISVLALALSYLSLLDVLPEKLSLKYRQCGLWLSLVFCLLSYWIYLPAAKRESVKLEQGLCEYRINGQGLVFPDAQKAKILMDMALEKGYYRLPELNCANLGK